MTTADCEVLVVGAGPSGMVAAAELARRGVSVLIVDKRAGPTPWSKATILWPRAIEVLADIDGDDRIRRECLAQERLAYHDGRTCVASVAVEDHLRPAVAPQNIVEAHLEEKLASLGVHIHWSTTAADFRMDAAGTDFSLTRSGEPVTHHRARYVVAADGAWSTCREAVGAKFDGDTHEMKFVVADVELEGDLDERTTYYWCSPHGIVVMTRLATGVWRVFTVVAPTVADEDIDVDLVRELVAARVPLAMTVGTPLWISPFRVHARQIDSMRHGSFLFVGDAAHIHSPAGGQGVNLGILDAHNLGWKLALVLQDEVEESVLDSFAVERGRAATAAIRQARGQTGIWMIRNPLVRAARNLLLRAVSRTELYRFWYLPWLLGYRTKYSTWAKVRPSLSELAVPNGRHLLGEDVGYRAAETGSDVRRAWLNSDRFTLLIREGATAPADRSIEKQYPAVVKSVPATMWPNVVGRDRRLRSAEALLVAPDGYVWSGGSVRSVVRGFAKLCPTKTSYSDAA